jgi:hypothetical protein
MSSLDEAKSIALRYAREMNPRVKVIEVASAEESLSGDKWIVEVAWPLDDEGISGREYAKITVTESGEVVGYTPQVHGRGVG